MRERAKSIKGPRRKRVTQWLALVLGASVFAGLGWLWSIVGAGFERDRLALGGPVAAPEASRSAQRAFYSGHSLSDHVPEGVAAIAEQFGGTLSFDVQSLVGSTVAERLLPANLDALGLPGHGYDFFVVTERHDLPYLLRHEDTVPNLERLHERVRAGSPNAQTLLYHVWLEIDVNAPERFIQYERDALVLWECTASAVNRRLQRAGRTERMRVLPGATALAALVERVTQGGLPELPGASTRERVQALFEDQVHPSALGRYFMSLVHYAALFGQSAVGAPAPSGIPAALGQSLQELAWEHVSAYRTRAAAAAQRDLDDCSEYARAVMCPVFAAHRREGEPVSAPRRWKERFTCQWDFAGSAPANPFR